MEKMAIRTIRCEGEACLRKTCKEVTAMTLRNRLLIEDMLDTMYKFDGVGLAAPQVGILKRIITIDIGEGPKVLINPVIINRIGLTEYWEACASCLDNCGKVLRPYKIDLEYYDIKGNKQLETFEGFETTVLSHEMDHLDGILI